VKTFAADYGAKWPKAVAKVIDDLYVLLSFYEFRAEHWIHQTLVRSLLTGDGSGNRGFGLTAYAEHGDLHPSVLITHDFRSTTASAPSTAALGLHCDRGNLGSPPRLSPGLRVLQLWSAGARRNSTTVASMLRRYTP
jgi:hypothetical protein